jgi:hypothetical protein
MTYNKPIRHGDVILIPTEKPSGKGRELKEYTLAYGEATGHSHHLTNMHPGVLLSLFEYGGKRIIELEDEWSLRHEEHREIKIPPGCYEIGIEREYDPFQDILREVRD